MNPQVLVFLTSSLPEGRVFGLDAQTFIQIAAQIVSVSLLAVVLSLLLYRPVSEFLRKRSDGIKEQLETAETAIVEANELKLQHEQKLIEIEKTRNEMFETARNQAIEMARQIVDEAKEEADTLRARTAANIKMEQERVQAEMKLAIITIASAMAQKFVTASMDAKTQDRLFNEAVVELEGLKWRN